MNTLKTTAGVLFIAACLTLPFALMTESQDSQTKQFDINVAACRQSKGHDAQLLELDGQLVCRGKKTLEAKL